jgi:hypothetical protein
LKRAIRSSADDVESARVDADAAPGDVGAGGDCARAGGGGVVDFGCCAMDDDDGERGIEPVGVFVDVVVMVVVVAFASGMTLFETNKQINHKTKRERVRSAHKHTAYFSSTAQLR